MAAFVVAVTGGVASGKSALTKQFERIGIVVADADVAARAVVAIGQPALQEIARRFGQRYLSADGSLDRGALRTLVFNDAGARHELEAITHPRIRVLLQQQCEAAAGPYAIAAIPLLAEAGASSYPWLQRVVVVDAPVALQRQRLMGRDLMGAAMADQMLAAQGSRQLRLSIATDVVVNDGPSDCLSYVAERLHAIFLRWLAVSQSQPPPRPTSP